MKRIIVLSAVLLLVTVGMAWAGTEAYKLVMSKDSKLCAEILKLFNADTKKYGEVRYEQHELFAQLKWRSYETGEKTYGCEILRYAIFDINNDETEDLVIKYSACLRSQLSDSLFVFPSDSDVLSRLKPGPDGWAPMFTAPNQFNRPGGFYSLSELDPAQNEGNRVAIGGVFKLNPFIWNKTSYVSMTDLFPEWVVIAKYLREDKFQDVCYLHGPTFRPLESQ